MISELSIDKNYNISKYLKDIDTYGMELVWENILSSIRNRQNNEIFSSQNFGELYEIGLANVNKEKKKEQGKYYTPIDVATIMSDWFLPLDGQNICDVCCGTGNLILSYLKKLNELQRATLLKNGNIYLYDKDPLALKICKETIGLLYGENNVKCINVDFLNKEITLPQDCKVICNPPYIRIKEIPDNWDKTEVVKDSKELYSAIMEKILQQSKSAVIITPYSFLGGSKFYSLRKELNNYNGFIVSFDNVPGNIFGNKKGVFNSNKANSVRASITVVENKNSKKGFRCSNLIRFKNKEKEQLLNINTLEQFVDKEYQLISKTHPKYEKCSPELRSLLNKTKQSSKTLSDLLIEDSSQFTLQVPNTCRYYSVATIRNLDRTGKHILYFRTKEDRDLAYCYLNSSFCYWHWRLFDGGITYGLSLLKEMPIFNLSTEDENKLLQIAKDMQEHEEAYLSYKKNTGKLQENIKFPDKYRKQINEILLKSLGFDNTDIFYKVHSNTALSTTEVLK